MTTQEIARLESALKTLRGCYVRAHPSAKSEPFYMHLPQTSHKSTSQLYARLIERIDELRSVA